MKAILKQEPAMGLTIGDVPETDLLPGQIRIRVKVGAVCGTDAHIYAWDEWARNRIRPPLVIGHEFAGEVAEVGPGGNGLLKEGDVVSAEGHIVCNTCYLCRTGQAHICSRCEIIGVDRPGAFATYITMPEANVWKIDSGIPIEYAALHDPLGNAVHTVMAEPVSGRSVLVQGCGPIGLFAIGLARSCGASTVIATDVNRNRLELARKFGAHEALHATEDDVKGRVLAATEGMGPESVLEMSGNPNAIRLAFELVRLGGDVRLLGIPSREVSLNLAEHVIFKGIRVHGIIGRKMYQTWYQLRSFLRSGLLDPAPAITHRLHYTEVEKGMEAIRSGEAGKVILNFD